MECIDLSEVIELLHKASVLERFKKSYYMRAWGSDYTMTSTTSFQNHVERRIKEIREREKQFRLRNRVKQ